MGQVSKPVAELEPGEWTRYQSGTGRVYNVGCEDEGYYTAWFLGSGRWATGEKLSMANVTVPVFLALVDAWGVADDAEALGEL